MSSFSRAVLQSGALCIGPGLGAGVGGLAGAEGRVLPGMTFGFAGIGMGMVGTLDMEPDGVLIGLGRECADGAFPWREAKKRLLCDCDGIRASEADSSSVGIA